MSRLLHGKLGNETDFESQVVLNVREMFYRDKLLTKSFPLYLVTGLKVPLDLFQNAENVKEKLSSNFATFQMQFYTTQACAHVIGFLEKMSHFLISEHIEVTRSHTRGLGLSLLHHF